MAYLRWLRKGEFLVPSGCYEMKDITAVILNWRTARMTRGAVMNLKKYYPEMFILIGDDCSSDKHGDWTRAYNRDAYYKEGKLDMDTSKLYNIPGTSFFQFEKHQGHGLTLDRIVKFVNTPLMLTMDSDMRLVGPGLVEEYLEKYNEDPENIYAVGTTLSEKFTFHQDGKDQDWPFVWIDPFFSLWNMEPLRRYERLSFSNLLLPGAHLGTALMLNRQLQYLDECHADRGHYRMVAYPDPDHIPQLYHLRRFPDDAPDSPRATKWEELMDG